MKCTYHNCDEPVVSKVLGSNGDINTRFLKEIGIQLCRTHVFELLSALAGDDYKHLIRVLKACKRDVQVCCETELLSESKEDGGDTNSNGMIQQDFYDRLKQKKPSKRKRESSKAIKTDVVVDSPIQEKDSE